jgi:hypothetical protein
LKANRIAVYASAFLALAACAAVTAKADTKAEMVAVVDKLADNKPGTEALVDWDNLVVNTPQTKNLDIKAMYKGMDAANKKAFRTSFLGSFSKSFKASASGHTFAEAAKVPGTITVQDTPPHPTMVLHQKGGKPDLKIFFSRKGKHLLFQGMETKG